MRLENTRSKSEKSLLPLGTRAARQDDVGHISPTSETVGLLCRTAGFVHFFFPATITRRVCDTHPSTPRGRLCSDPIYPLVPLPFLCSRIINTSAFLTARWNLAPTTPPAAAAGPQFPVEGSGAGKAWLFPRPRRCHETRAPHRSGPSLVASREERDDPTAAGIV